MASPDKQSYLIIGDLSFFYDMNSIKINSLGDNVHILLLNIQVQQNSTITKHGLMLIAIDIHLQGTISKLRDGSKKMELNTFLLETKKNMMLI